MDQIDFSLRGLIKEYGGLKRAICTIEFVLSVICVLLFIGYVRYFAGPDAGYFAKELATHLMGVSASLFGILFATFAIIISLSDAAFIKFLQRHKVLDKILLPFWLVSILYIADVIVNILVQFFPPEIAQYLMALSVFIFSWALLGTACLITDTINFGRRRATYLEYEKEIREMEDS